MLTATDVNYGHYQLECRTNLSKGCGEKSNFVKK